uniref:Uncharacterized protein n=1 Tax=Anguilla anguilla TaxID=7936 RepID=A0A0E9XDZ8_ANGAN
MKMFTMRTLLNTAGEATASPGERDQLSSITSRRELETDTDTHTNVIML